MDQSVASAGVSCATNIHDSIEQMLQNFAMDYVSCRSSLGIKSYIKQIWKVFYASPENNEMKCIEKRKSYRDQTSSTSAYTIKVPQNGLMLSFSGWYDPYF